MARRRFFVPQIRRGEAELTGSDAEHLVRVLRADEGEVYEISDNQEVYLARITVARKSSVVFEIMERLDTPMEAAGVTLIPALFKFDHFEWLVEKATELGVGEIIPFEATRTERGLMQAAAKRRVRWERIALEASQQCRRARLPVVAEATGFRAAIGTSAEIRLLLDESALASPILDAVAASYDVDQRVALLLGPEGGWTDEERSQAINAGWIAASLGPTILRAETAGIAGLAVLRAWREAGKAASL